MAKPSVAPKKTVKTEEKPAVKKVEHEHEPLPVLQPAKPLDLASLRKRLLDLGIEWDKKEDVKALKAKLDVGLKAKLKEVEEEWLADEDDCFGKPDIRDVKDADCQKCPDFGRCGEVAAVVLGKRKEILDHVEAEADIEDEVSEVDAVEAKGGKPKARSEFKLPEYLRVEEITEVTEDITLEYDDKPDFSDLGPEDEKLKAAVKFLYTTKPKTLVEFRRVLVLGFLKKPRSAANEVTVKLAHAFIDGGFMRAKKGSK